MNTDRRLIEDYIPIDAISDQARREKSTRKGHIATLHLWWARRPLVAARAAVYSSLVPALAERTQAQAERDFVALLCTYPPDRVRVMEARNRLLSAHAVRLTEEHGERVTAEDIEAGRAPRPRVLDMFAGGGAIPLEALRLGCDTYALDLNPVAHLIELCTLVYPQQYGAPDPAARGSAPDGTWAGLAAEVDYWGRWVLERLRAEIGDLYPPIPDPRTAPALDRPVQLRADLTVREVPGRPHEGLLTPVAYLWTRTVFCKNPACGATVPLARQTWLAEKTGRYVALKAETAATRHLPGAEKRVRYSVVEAKTEQGLGFDPEAGSKGGNVACPFCGTVVDSGYVRAEASARRVGVQPLTVICTRLGEQGKVFLTLDQLPAATWPDDNAIWQRIQRLADETANNIEGPLTPPTEPIEANPRSMDVQNYGFQQYSDLFLPRQLLTLLTFARYVRSAYHEIEQAAHDPARAKAIATALAFVADRLADWNSTLCTWAPEHTGGAKIRNTFARQALPMVWDFVESGVFGDATGSAALCLEWVVKGLEEAVVGTRAACVTRGSATDSHFEEGFFDAVITDPPYYDNVTYSNLSDFFYVWLKRSIGFLYPEHFSAVLTPKKKEAIAAAYRSGGRDEARQSYENLMAQAFAQAKRVLKPGGPLVVVYAHKTTLGWATLVDALRYAAFTVTEAWPLDTEMAVRIRALDTASLASSIFLVARRREGAAIGSYEDDVLPELHQVVRERVARLWALGVTGADLVIACVGAGLRAFTRFAQVEYANGTPVPADRFLEEVEGAVLDALLERLFGVSQAGVSQVDAITRFYVLWRYTYRGAPVDAGEAILFAYPQQVELDGPAGLAAGSNPLVEKRGSQYRLRDYAERGADEDLGRPGQHGQAPLIDVLHRLLWLMQEWPAAVRGFLDEAAPDAERLRVVVNTLAGPALDGGATPRMSPGGERGALQTLLTNWRTLVEEPLFRRREATNDE